MKPFFSEEAIAEQMLLENECCVVLLPQNPVYDHHFMITPKRKDAHIFTELTIKELVAIQDLIRLVIETFQEDAAFNNSGYNLFCNNGSELAGQHVNQFHMHLFLRSADEQVSPYELMNKNIRWASKDTDEWQRHKTSLKARFRN